MTRNSQVDRVTVGSRSARVPLGIGPAVDKMLTVRCFTRVVGPEDVLDPAGRTRRVERSNTRIGHGRPGAWNRVFWGPCLERVRASERLERDVRVAGPVRVGARGVGTRWSGVSTGRTWPRPTAGTMERIAAVTVDGTPFESN